MDKNEEILERIAKLLEVSTRNHQDGFVEEAQNAAALAMKLITKHQLDQSEVENYASKSREDRENPMSNEFVDPEMFGIKTFKRKIGWRSMLSACVADACSVTVSNGSKHNKSVFIGRRTDVKAAAYVYVYLLRALEDAATNYMSSHSFSRYDTQPNGRVIEVKVKPAQKTKIRNTYLAGMVSAVGKKVEWYRKQAVNGFGSPERALVFLGSRKQAAVDFAIDELGFAHNTAKYKSLKENESYQQSLAAGYAHARDNIHLPQAIEGGKEVIRSLN